MVRMFPSIRVDVPHPIRKAPLPPVRGFFFAFVALPLCSDANEIQAIQSLSKLMQPEAEERQRDVSSGY